MPGYEVDITDEAEEDLAYYRAFERKTITDTILKQLTDQPAIESNNRKRLRDNPLARWELRIGRYRVFYEIEQENNAVIIISIGHKEHNVLYIRGKAVKL